jgi:hypothetical protein
MATFRAEVHPEIQLRVLGCGGDVQITGHDSSTLSIEGDTSLESYVRQEGDTVTITGYPSSLQIELSRQASVELSGISGDVEVRAVTDLGARTMTKLRAHGLGGNVEIADVAEIELEAVGGDAEIEHTGEGTPESGATVKIGHVGGNLTINRAAYLSVRAVGGDAEIGEIDRMGSLGHIGGNLQLALLGSIEGKVRSVVGGNAEVRLPEAPDLSLVAVVGGNFNGAGGDWNIRRGPGRHRLVFGEGRSQFHVMVGGNLEMAGGTAPQQATGFAGYHAEGSADWQDMRGTMEGFGEEMREFARELEAMGNNLARDLSNLGRDIAREVRVAGRETIRDVVRGYKPGRMPGFGRGRGPQGDFGFAPEQIERIKREARAAAAGGIARAQEAVEQALQQWQQGRPGHPTPPRAPVPPRGPVAPPRPPSASYTGQTVRIEHEPQHTESEQSTPQQSTNRDAERLAILRMVHEGRLAPDEAEMLLRGLDERA